MIERSSMSTIYNALKKAEQEGNIDESWVPQISPKSKSKLPPIELNKEITKEFLALKQAVQQAHTEQGKQIFTVTSSIAGEGCTTIAYYLALMLVQSMNDPDNDEKFEYSKFQQRGILIIDGNLEKPALHKLFNVDQRMGLTEFMMSTNSSIYTKKIYTNKMNLITSGNSNKQWHDLWNSDRIELLFNNLRQQYEYIFIDAPPVISQPETLALSKFTDGALLVVKANETRTQVIQEAADQLQNNGVKVLGVVLNERKFFIPKGIYKRI